MPANAGISSHLAKAREMRGGWVYIMVNKSRGLPYVGVTAHLAARVHQHRTDPGSAFCRRHGLNTLVLAEQYDTIEEAITREKQLKAWQRTWKTELIEAGNPDWSDLYERLA